MCYENTVKLYQYVLWRRFVSSSSSFSSFSFFVVEWMNEKHHTKLCFSFIYVFGHLFTCFCVLFFLTFDFFEEVLKKFFEVWIFENSTFFCEENVLQNQNRFRPSSSRVRWWWFGRLLRGSESQNAFDRWSSLKGRLSKSVRLRRGCCVGGDALVVLVVLVFFCVCVRLCRSKRKSK